MSGDTPNIAPTVVIMLFAASRTTRGDACSRSCHFCAESQRNTNKMKAVAATVSRKLTSNSAFGKMNTIRPMVKQRLYSESAARLQRMDA